MGKIRRYIFILLMCPLCISAAGTSVIDDIIEQLRWQMADEMDSLLLLDVQEDLEDLMQHPINLNAASASQLGRLPFLTGRQIDEILLYAYHHPYVELYELQQVPLLTAKDIHNLLPFVCIGEAPREPENPRQWFRYAEHRILLRTDARQIEATDWAAGADPFALRLQYHLRATKHLQMSLQMRRDANEPFYVPHKTYGMDFYGGSVSLSDIGCLSKAVAGDYRISWEQGLVMGMTPGIGTTGVRRTGKPGTGLRAVTTPVEYDFLRGGAAELTWGEWHLSLAASYRRIDGVARQGVFRSIRRTGYHRTEGELAGKRGVGQQVYAAQLGWHRGDVKVSLSAVAHLLSDTLRPINTYYNAHYFRGRRQWVTGAAFTWRTGDWYLFGEAAAASNERWGGAAILGARYLLPEQATELLAVARYYSPWYDNLLGGADYMVSRAHDERSVEVGADSHIGQNVQLQASVRSGYFRYPKYGLRTGGVWGVNGRLQMDIAVSDWLTMLRANVLSKGDFLTARLQLQETWQQGDWQVRMQAGATYCPKDSVTTASSQVVHRPTYGAMVGLQAGWTPERWPVRLRAGVVGFYAPYYRSRMSAYETTVQGSLGMTQLYGEGAHLWLMAHYQICSWCTLEAQAGSTLYTRHWREQRGMRESSRTSAQLLLLFAL